MYLIGVSGNVLIIHLMYYYIETIKTVIMIIKQYPNIQEEVVDTETDLQTKIVGSFVYEITTFY